MSGFNFGGAGASTGGFTFGTSKTATTTTTPATGFSFSTNSTGRFSFGTTTPAQPAAVAANTPSTSLFSLASQSPATPAAPAAQTAQTSGFSFGTTTPAQGGTGFSLGVSIPKLNLGGTAAAAAPTPAPASTGFGLSGSTIPAAAAAATTTAASSQASTGFIFSSAATATTTSTATSSTPLGFSFNSGGLSQTASSGFTLGSFGSTTQPSTLSLQPFTSTTPAATGGGAIQPIVPVPTAASTSASAGTTLFSSIATASTSATTGSSGPTLGTSAITPGVATTGFTLKAPGVSSAVSTAATTTVATVSGSSFVSNAKTAAPTPISVSQPTALSILPSVSTATGVSGTSVMTYAQLESLINKWSLELEDQERHFLQQATQVNAWDRTLIENGEKITSLHREVEKVKLDQKRLDQELDFILSQQKELEDLLSPLEEAVKEQSGTVYLQHADEEREKTYKLAENIDAQLKRMAQDLKDIIEHLNTAGGPADTSDPLQQICKILNAHMDSLQWIDQNSALLQRKVEEEPDLARQGLGTPAALSAATSTCLQSQASQDGHGCWERPPEPAVLLHLPLQVMVQLAWHLLSLVPVFLSLAFSLDWKGPHYRDPFEKCIQDPDYEQLLKVMTLGLNRTTKPQRVIVVGAGLAGLVTAKMLGDAGHKVTLLEADSRIGGRILTYRDRKTGWIGELGAMRMPTSHRIMHQLCKNLGLNLTEFIQYDENTWTEVRDVKLRNYVVEKMPEKLGYNLRPHEQGHSPEEIYQMALNKALKDVKTMGCKRAMKKFDSISLLGYLLGEGNISQAAARLLGDVMSKDGFFHLSFAEALRAHSCLSDKLRYSRVTGGWDLLPRALLSSLSGPVLLHSPVVGLTQTAREVHVHFASDPPFKRLQVATADLAVLTPSGPALQRLSFSPPLSRLRREALRALHYVPATKVFLSFARPFWAEEHIRGGHSNLDRPSRLVFYPPPREGALLLAAYTWADATAPFAGLSVREALHLALRDLASLHGPVVYRLWDGTGVVKRWADDPHSHGGFVVQPPALWPGGDSEPDWAVPYGRIYFAGEHTARPHGWVETAVKSALRAAVAINHRAEGRGPGAGSGSGSGSGSGTSRAPSARHATTGSGSGSGPGHREHQADASTASPPRRSSD